MKNIIRDNTPIEKYLIGEGKEVFVKREDLCVVPPAPALAKLRGVHKRLLSLKGRGINLVGVLDTRISKSAWGVAYLAREMGIKVVAYYPHLKAYTEVPMNQRKAQEMGAEVYPLKGGRTAVVYSWAKKDIEGRGGYMMPMGLVVKESINAVSEEAKRIPQKYLGGSIVLCVGSGMTIAGVALGLADKVKTIYGISVGMSTDRQRKKIKDTGGFSLPQNVKLILPDGVNYYDFEETETPFSSSPYYDKKAWVWMLKNWEKISKPLIFWNIGV